MSDYNPEYGYPGLLVYLLFRFHNISYERRLFLHFCEKLFLFPIKIFGSPIGELCPSVANAMSEVQNLKSMKILSETYIHT